MYAFKAQQVRGGVIIEDRVGVRFTLILGFDLAIVQGEEEIFVPGMFGQRWDGKHTFAHIQKEADRGNEDGIENLFYVFRPCTHTSECVEKGCSRMPGELKLYGTSGVVILAAHTRHQTIGDETLFTVTLVHQARMRMSIC